MKLASRLKRHFARAARKAAILAAGVFFSAAALAQTRPEGAEAAPAPVIEAAALTQAQQGVPDINVMLEDFGRTPLGRDMLSFAKESGVSISYDAALIPGSSYALYVAQTNAITIMPEAETSATMVFLAHEIYHAWQQHYLDYNGMRGTLITPEQRWNLSRYIEASAFAFSAYFLADRLIRLKNDDSVTPSAAVREIFVLARYIVYENESEDGLTLKEYRDNILRPCFAGLHGYNKKHEEVAAMANEMLGGTMRIVNKKMDDGDYRGAEYFLDDFCDRLSKTPDEKDFTAYLRRFGGTSLDPAAPTCLQDSSVTAATILKGYPRQFDIFAESHGYSEWLDTRLESYNRIFETLKGVLIILEKRLRAESAIPAALPPRQAPVQRPQFSPLPH